MINLAQLLGRVGRLETKSLNNGGTVTNISLVTTIKFEKNGEKQEKATWHNVALYGKLSEIADKWVSVGDLVYIQGEMDNQKYMHKDGSERVRHFITGREIKLLPNNKEKSPEPKAQPQTSFVDDGIPW